MNFYSQIALSKIKGVGPKLARNLLAYCGSAEEVFRASPKALSKIPGIGLQVSTEIKSRNYEKDTEKEIAFIAKHNIQVLWIENKDYPKRLKNCEDAPILMYYKGNAELNQSKIISIVGSRNATAYGRRICENMLEQLKTLNPLIVSGLAYGIDVQAHRSAITAHIPTVGVLGHGLDRIYPASHREVATKMIQHGGLLTEFPADTRPERQNFPMRNRIIAGIADVTIVVEAAITGGALITAEIANTYNRDVCAFPGAVDQPYSAGCNYLIKTNRAHLIRDVHDLCYVMNWDLDQQKNGVQLALMPPDMNQDQTIIYNFIKEHQQAAIDAISMHCKWPQSKLAILLLEMEMSGFIISLPGKVYKL